MVFTNTHAQNMEKNVLKLLKKTSFYKDNLMFL